MAGGRRVPWPESYEWEVIAQFSFDGEPYADPAAPKEERRRRVVLTLRLNSPRSLYGSCRQHNSYEISLRNEDNTTRGMWNEGHGDLFIEDRPVMQHRDVHTTTASGTVRGVLLHMELCKICK